MGRKRSALTWLCAVTVLLSAAIAPAYIWCVTADGTQMELATGEGSDHGHTGCDRPHASWVHCDDCTDLPLTEAGVFWRVSHESPSTLSFVRFAVSSSLAADREPSRIPSVSASVAPDCPVLKRTVSLLI